MGFRLKDLGFGASGPEWKSDGKARAQRQETVAKGICRVYVLCLLLA